MWLQAKHAAIRKGLEFSIEVSDIVIPKTCPVLGIKLVWAKGRNACPSIDRRNNDLGYTRENIRVISMKANRLKNNATVEELKAILQYMS
jgi:hypothetical protein